MANAITGAPNQYDFGYEFDYSLWTEGTQLDLVNVPWNNDYRDVVGFNNTNALDTYINSLSSSGIRVNNVSYVKPYQPVRVDIPHSIALRYNYLRATNPLQPIPNDRQKSFYYFILDAKYVAPNTTELILQLDVWNTFIFDIKFGNCYVERGHIGIANTKQFEQYGRNYLTTPEGLDTGSDYVRRSQLFMSGTDGADPVVAISTVDIINSGGTVDSPKLLSAPGSYIDGIPSGATYYGWNSSASFNSWMSSMAEKPWVTQGIIIVAIIPRLNEFYNITFSGNSTPVRINDVSNKFKLDGGKVTTMQGSSGQAWRDKLTYLDNRYKHLKKFLVYPYLIAELTTFTGQPLLIKPECWNTPNASIVEMMTFLMPNAKHSIRPRNYNASSDDGTHDNGEGLDFATGFSEFVKTAVVNNGALSYLSANSNSLAYQTQSAEWAQQRALGAAQADYDISTGAISANTDLAAIGINADYAQTQIANRTQIMQAGVQGAASIVGGFGGGAAFGPAPALAGTVSGGAQGLATVANAAIQAGSNSEQQAVRAGATTKSTYRQNDQASLVRDTNKGLADWAARGDYANAIAGINAKVQDANMIQPTTSGQAGGTQFNLATDNWNIILRFKSLDDAHIEMIGEYWLRYGYSIHRFIKPPASLRVMTKFTYWKMLETYISSSTVPESMKQAIRGILEKGVTVWTTPSDIGNIDIADNAPLGGISY